MLKKIIKNTTLLLLFATVLGAAILPLYAESGAKSWYCVRRKDHLQPRADADMRYIEDYGGIYIDKNHGDECSSRVVYLTFDAGYENGNVGKIVDILSEKDVRAAFFILGNLINTSPELIKKMIDGNHTVCNHTFHHKDMTGMNRIEDFAAELTLLENLYRDKTGCEMSKYYRPPEGKFDEKTMKYAQELGYRTIFWSFAYADWDNNKQPSPECAKNKILENLHNGAIILLHPTSATNAEILGDVIDEIRSEGYSFGTLDELFNG